MNRVPAGAPADRPRHQPAAAPTQALLGPPAELPADWPGRAHSHCLSAGGLRWHLQLAGQGPTVLLLHGTGASAHSWAGLLPILLPHATVLAPDLPGHGFTRGAALQDLSLPRMAAALQGLLQALQLPPPRLLVGHSAGAALALRLALLAQAEGAGAAQEAPGVLGFAPSLVAPPEVYTRWMAPLMNPVATSGPVAWLTARLAAPSGLIDGLLASTGSPLSSAQRQPYRQLFRDRGHVRGAMGFMAAADLPALNADAAALRGPRLFVLGQRDRWIPERLLRPVLQRHHAGAQVQLWPGGHLVHEEDPQRAAQAVLALLGQVAGAERPAGVPGQAAAGA